MSSSAASAADGHTTTETVQRRPRGRPKGSKSRPGSQKPGPKPKQKLVVGNAGGQPPAEESWDSEEMDENDMDEDKPTHCQSNEPNPGNEANDIVGTRTDNDLGNAPSTTASPFSTRNTSRDQTSSTKRAGRPKGSKGKPGSKKTGPKGLWKRVPKPPQPLPPPPPREPPGLIRSSRRLAERIKEVGGTGGELGDGAGGCEEEQERGAWNNMTVDAGGGTVEVAETGQTGVDVTDEGILADGGECTGVVVPGNIPSTQNGQTPSSSNITAEQRCRKAKDFLISKPQYDFITQVQSRVTTLTKTSALRTFWFDPPEPSLDFPKRDLFILKKVYVWAPEHQFPKVYPEGRPPCPTCSRLKRDHRITRDSWSRPRRAILDDTCCYIVCYRYRCDTCTALSKSGSHTQPEEDDDASTPSSSETEQDPTSHSHTPTPEPATGQKRKRTTVAPKRKPPLTFYTWDEFFLSQQPSIVQNVFPFILTTRSAILKSMVERMTRDVKKGKGVAASHEGIYQAHYRKFKEAEEQYERSISFFREYGGIGKSGEDGGEGGEEGRTTEALSADEGDVEQMKQMLLNPEPFGKFDDTDGWNGFVPSEHYLETVIKSSRWFKDVEVIGGIRGSKSKHRATSSTVAALSAPASSSSSSSQSDATVAAAAGTMIGRDTDPQTPQNNDIMVRQLRDLPPEATSMFSSFRLPSSTTARASFPAAAAAAASSSSSSS
ncbi:hypothetical protein HK102_006128, partial [Quaeritorhiza haematococci]